MDDPAPVASVAAMMDDTRQEHGMSEVRTLTLTEFLTARLDEDEEWAQTSGTHTAPGAFARDNYGCLLVTTDRVLAEVEAKRRIVEWAALDLGSGHSTMIARLLALPYADHPDFNPEWRP